MAQAPGFLGDEAEKLSLLIEASSRLLSSLSLTDVLSSILDLSARILPADAYSIWRRKAGIWGPVVSQGLSAGYLRQALPRADTIPPDPIILHDIGSNPLLADRLALYESEGIKALVAIPLQIQGELAGTLVFYSRRPHTYTPLELKMASALGNLAGAAITTAELYDKQRHLREETEELQKRTAFLAEASRVLASSLDFETTLRTVACLAVGHLADWCAVDIADEEGRPRRLATTHLDPEKIRWAEELRRQYPPDPDSGAWPVIRSGKPVFVPKIEDEQLVASARDPEHLRLLRELGLTSFIGVPMRTRDTVLGGLSLVSSESGRLYTEADLALAEDLANRCALAVENARLYTMTRETAARESRARTEAEALLLSLQKAQKEATDAHEQLRNVLESTRDAFLALDTEGRVTHANERAAAILRQRRADLAGRNVWELLPHTPVRSFARRLREAARKQEPVQFEEFLAELELWLELSAFPTRSGFAIFGRDITEKKRFEEQLRQTAKLESLGVLAGGVAHDFNNLLVGILGGASLALESVSPSSPVRETLEDVVTATERAANLTKQLLAYAGKGQFVIRPLDLSEVLREITALLESSIPRSVQLRVKLAEGLPSVEGDAAQIQQLFMNLIINAAEAIGPGTPGTVTVSTSVQEVDENYIRQVLTPSELRPGTYVSVEVNDTGCGMTPETMARIFDPFFTTKFTGRGLGLAAALGIVRGHKGALKVYSAPGEGSTFKVLFPGRDAAPEKPAAEHATTALTGSGLILIIDDEETVRRTAKKTLEQFGYQAVVADNGQEGLKLFEILGDKVALVLLDLTMPLMGGEEALQRFKTLRPGVKVLLSSGFNEVEAIQRFTGKGLAGFIQKPYTARSLAEAVRRALTRPD